MIRRWLTRRGAGKWASTAVVLLAIFTVSPPGLPAAAAATATAPTNVRAWGDNSTGQLGIGHSGDFRDVRVLPKGLGPVTAVSGGGIYALALLGDGTVMAWGDNGSGQLGDGTTTSRTAPVKVHGLKGVVAISAGAQTSLALLSNGTAMAWGDGQSGELGDGSAPPISTVPVPVVGIDHLIAVNAAENFSFALRNDGRVFAWGDNGAGELGIGSTIAQSDVPVEITRLKGVKTVVGGTLHALAVMANGTVMSWGANGDGELGTGTRNPNGSNVPVKVDTVRTAVGVSAGYAHSAAVLANGTVMSWGSNQDGQLGIGTRNFLSSDDPIAVEGVHTATSISSGAFTTQALLKDGTVMGWGADDVGELGDGTTNPEVVSPVKAVNVSGATSLTAGGAFTLVIVR
jgi:alpha-tubulin suppressor-like RCC1 family protein